MTTENTTPETPGTPTTPEEAYKAKVTSLEAQVISLKAEAKDAMVKDDFATAIARAKESQAKEAELATCKAAEEDRIRTAKAGVAVALVKKSIDAVMTAAKDRFSSINVEFHIVEAEGVKKLVPAVKVTIDVGPMEKTLTELAVNNLPNLTLEDMAKVDQLWFVKRAGADALTRYNVGGKVAAAKATITKSGNAGKPAGTGKEQTILDKFATPADLAEIDTSTQKYLQNHSDWSEGKAHGLAKNAVAKKIAARNGIDFASYVP